MKKTPRPIQGGQGERAADGLAIRRRRHRRSCGRFLIRMTGYDGHCRSLWAIGLASEVIGQALHGVHAGVLHRPLSDLDQGAERYAALTSDLSLWDGFGTQMSHHEFVNLGRDMHGLKAYSHLWLKAIAAHGFFKARQS